VRFNGRYHFYLYRGLSEVVRAVMPDIIHIDEEPYNPAGAQAQRLAERVGARTLFVVLQNLYKAYPPPFSLLEQYNYRHTAHIIACNADAGEVVRRKGYRGPLSTFAVYGVDPDLYAPTERRNNSDEFVIGYLGRLVLYKGLGVLIEAMRGLPKNCRLRLVGSGPDKDELERMAREFGVAERVEFAPAVAAAVAPRVLADMDTLALPSLTRPNWMEQFGRVLIEAMGCGVPVVGSDSGEIPRVIGDAGVIVPEGNVEALRAALRDLAERPERRRELAERGRARVLANFTQEQVAARLAEVYEQTLAGKAPDSDVPGDAPRG
jgi:glycosyltransferase involved in cell wall biosynthesis